MRRLVLGLGGVAVCAGLLAWGLPVFGVLRGGPQQFQSRGSEYERANALIRKASGGRAYYGMDVLLQPDAGRQGELSTKAAVSALDVLVAARRGFQRLLDPPAAGRDALVLAAFATPGDSVAAAKGLRESFSAGQARRRLAGWRVSFGGPDLAFHALEALTSGAAERVERYAIPALCVGGFLVFGGVVFALPLLIGLLTAIITFAALRLLDVLGVGISVYCLSAVTGLSLGLGIDYSLLMLTRYREETARGARSQDAISRMRITAGRTVGVSSLTIATAMASLLIFPLEFLSSTVIAAAITVLIAGALARALLPRTPLPAAPSTGLERVLWRRAAYKHSDGGIWRRLASVVTSHPRLVAVSTTVLLLAAAAPAFDGLRLVAPSADLLPASAESHQVERAIASHFAVDPAGVIYTAYRPQPQEPPADVLARREAQIANGQARMFGPQYLGAGTWEISLWPKGNPNSQANQNLLARIRRATRPAGALTGGIAAYAADQRSAIDSHLLPALLILSLVSFTALWLLTGSVVIAGKGVLMALLSAAAGIGLLVAILGPVEEANLIFTGAIAIALSTDYELFLISRISEERDRGLSNRDAIVAGLTRTGPVITSAALLFCAAVGALALSPLFFARQFGLGATLTIVIDATFVRALLVPSLMSLLGERNWWSPPLLAQLHRRIESLPRTRASTPFSGLVSSESAIASGSLGSRVSTPSRKQAKSY